MSHTIGWVREQRAKYTAEDRVLTHRLIERLYERVAELERRVKYLESAPEATDHRQTA